MRRWSRQRFFLTDVAVLSIVAVVVVVLGLTTSRSGGLGRDAPVAVTVRADGDGRLIPAGFLGLSLEYPALRAYAGSDPAALDPVFEQLVRNLAPGQRPVLRIGGDSADWTWWPLSDIARPPGVTFDLDQGWLAVARALTHALDARLILGLNLEADSTELARVERQVLSDGLGADSIAAFQLGNEPELYGTFAWYRTATGKAVPGRPHSYDFNAFLTNFRQFADALPGVALAGPSSGGSGWASYLDRFLAGEPQVRLLAIHRYPLQLCFTRRGQPNYPTIPHLLSATASTGLADSFGPSVATAHAHHVPLRIDELNTVACGADPAVSNTFASALWVLDTLFEMTRVGIDGVNIHTFPGAGYELFHFTRVSGRWRGSVAPEYYGLAMFAQAAPPGSRLVSVSAPRNGSLKVWATETPDGRLRIVLINKSLTHARVIALAVPGRRGQAQLARLQAPAARAAVGVTIAGQHFGPASGRLSGPRKLTWISAADGRYVVNVPPVSAATVMLR